MEKNIENKEGGGELTKLVVGDRVNRYYANYPVNEGIITRIAEGIIYAEFMIDCKRTIRFNQLTGKVVRENPDPGKSLSGGIERARRRSSGQSRTRSPPRWRPGALDH